MKRLLIGGVCLLALVTPIVLAQDAKPEVRIEKDIVYGKGGDTELRLDIALPKDGDGPFPVIVCVHGGGWREGSRQQFDDTIKAMAGRGYVAATIGYRLVPAQFPAQIEDCKAAIRYLRANAKKYKIDPGHIGAVGFSAGGHLVCLLGTTDKNDGLEGSGGNPKESSAVQAVVSFFGPTDFTMKTWSDELEKSLLAPFMGGSFADKAEAYKKASPIVYVKKGAPPFLFFHGSEDKLVAIRHSRVLAEKLKSVGSSAQLVEMEGEGHGWRGEKLTHTITQMLAFFDDQLKSKGK